MSRRLSFFAYAFSRVSIALFSAIFLFQGVLHAKDSPASALKGFGMTSREPIVINADRLEISQKKSEATYAGNVTVIQGDVRLFCATLTIRLNAREDSSQAVKKKRDFSMLDMNAGGLKNLECAGGVRVLRDTLTAKGERLSYEEGVITLTGEKVVLSDGKNVQTGKKLVYDTLTDRGVMDGGRVRAVFTFDADAPKDPSKLSPKKPSLKKPSLSAPDEQAGFFVIPPTQP